MYILIEGLLFGSFLFSDGTGYAVDTVTSSNSPIVERQYEDTTVKNKQNIYKILQQKGKNAYAFLETFDLESDDSLQKFVTAGKSFTDKSYAPADLVYIRSDVIEDVKGNSQMRKEANEALQKMGKQFYIDKGYVLKNVSAYRSYDYQLKIEQGGCPPELCARAGFSEHQSGLAIDFFSASTLETWEQSEQLTQVFTWLNANAYKYGFHNSYQRGKEIDGYSVEPWHRRYVGVALATYLHEKNMTFAEYYTAKKEKEDRIKEPWE